MTDYGHAYVLRPRIHGAPLNYMSERNKKLKKQSAHRNRAEGSAYFATTHSVKRERIAMSEKKMRSEGIKEEKTRAERKQRVGKPQPFMLGNRTRTDKGRAGYSDKRPNRLSHIFEWGDPAAGSKYIRAFNGESAKPHLTLIVRIFLNDNFEFYNDEWRKMILDYLIKTYNLSSTEVLATLKTRLLSIKNNKDYMTRAINRFGPAFLPQGFVIVQGQKEFIHNIPIKNFSLLNAQSAFVTKQGSNVLEAHALLVRAQPKVKSSLNGSHGEVTNSDDVFGIDLDIFSMAEIIYHLLHHYDLLTSGIILAVGYYFFCDWRTFARIHGYLFSAILTVPILFFTVLTRMSIVLLLPLIFLFFCTITLGLVWYFLMSIWYPVTRAVVDQAIEINLWTRDKIFGVLRGGGGSRKKMEKKNMGLMKKGFLKSKHMGSGGKSKVKREPLPKVSEPSEESDQESVVSEDGSLWDRKQLIDEFRFSKTPNIQTTHFTRGGGIPRGDMFVDFDCHGAPFCGLTCIDVALGILPKPDVYCQMAKHMGNVYDLGESASVAAYAHYRGVNLQIITPMQDAQGAPFLYRYNSCNNPQWRWVILKLSAIGGGDYVAGTVGHYTLCCNDRADSTELEIPMVDTTCYIKAMCVLLIKLSRVNVNAYFFVMNSINEQLQIFGHGNDRNLAELARQVHLGQMPDLGLLIYAYLCFTTQFWEHNGVLYRWRYKGPSYNRNNNDVRSVEERSEPFAVQDHYGHFSECVTYYLCGFPVFDFYNRHRIVSVVRCVKAMKEVQFLGSSDLQRVFFGLFKGNICNTNDSLTYIYKDTQCYVLYLIQLERITTECFYQNLVIAYNDLGAAAYIGNLPNVGVNQGIRGGCNHIKKLKKLTPMLKEDADKRRIVACAPIGAAETEKGTIGPGIICRTEYYSLLAAFSGRSMQRVARLNDEVDAYIKFSKKFLSGFLNRVDLTGIFEQDPLEYFQHLYKGKKTRNWIECKVKSYNDYKNGIFNKKFIRHSCFVKKEDSRKRVGGEIRAKPRLIMTMSDKSLIETCQIMKIIHAWCASPFSKYQVKNLLPCEFVDKIQKFTETAHIVTDYSSFEASVFGAIRDIEHYFVRNLCKRSGLEKTLKSYENNFVKPRELHCKAGVFVINSRCSGDFMTSVGNGLQNICLSAYSHYKNFGSLNGFEIIAEGDDGLIRNKTVNMTVLDNLGFSFSSALQGTSPGDVDFLRCRWMYGLCFLNVGRVVKNVFWVKPKSQVGPNVLLQLLKCMAMSLDAVSTGHPILFEIVNRIGRATSKIVVSNKTLVHNMDWFKMKNTVFKNYCPTNVKCNELMRKPMAQGAAGFPPIPICVQLELERRLRDDKVPFYIGDLLDSYEDISDMKSTSVWSNASKRKISDEISQLLTLLEP